MAITLRPATPADTATILELIGELAEYEKLAHEATGSLEDLRDALFGDHPAAEVVLAEVDRQVAGYALFFHNFSTFHCRRGLYLEDLFVQPDRGQGIGKACCDTWRGWHWNADAPGSNGRCSTGIARRSTSTGASAPFPWLTGPSFGWTAPPSRRLPPLNRELDPLLRVYIVQH